MTERNQRPWTGLVGWAAVTFATAAIGGAASMRSDDFYGQLATPAWAPPASVFGPVWTVLYMLMALAAWMVWRRAGWQGARLALTLYLVQLVLNALWTWCFFAWRMGGLAFADIVLLWLVIAATIWLFWRVRPLAGMLMLPYLAWVSFAAFLNHAAWRMNPQLLG
jgi:tryptophan-rich sensory protein